jgi:nicotinic acid mononucleotide adenylyltransferase
MTISEAVKEMMARRIIFLISNVPAKKKTTKATLRQILRTEERAGRENSKKMTISEAVKEMMASKNNLYAKSNFFSTLQTTPVV